MMKEIFELFSRTNDTCGLTQCLSYSSWRRHQKPVSLRPLGARSSHWYIPQRPSSSGIGVVDHFVLEHKRTHARRITCVRGRVCSTCGRVVDDTLRRCPVLRPVGTVVVFGDLLLLGDRDVEIEVEVAADR